MVKVIELGRRPLSIHISASMLNNFIPVKGVGDTICRFLRFFFYYAVAILSLVLVREI